MLNYLKSLFAGIFSEEKSQPDISEKQLPYTFGEAYHNYCNYKKSKDYHNEIIWLFKKCYIETCGYSDYERLKYILENDDPSLEDVLILSPLIAPATVRELILAKKRAKMSDEDFIKLYHETVNDKILLAHLFTADEVLKYLLEAMDKGVDPVNKKIKNAKKFKVKNF